MDTQPDSHTTGCEPRRFAAFAMSETAAAIRAAAHRVHADVNQHYDSTHPYSFHLDMVADNVARFADRLPVDPGDEAAVWFGAMFHDSIEDARMTYRDVLAMAQQFMPDDKAVTAAEIVYALTNEKGRTRAERANERYYSGIRLTPYAVMVKMADRLANLSYAMSHLDGSRSEAMSHIYGAELPHFIEALTGDTTSSDHRLRAPQEMIDELISIV